MNARAAGFLLAFCLPVCAFANESKITTKDLAVRPYCGTEGHRLLDPKDRTIFDELRVTMSGGPKTRFRISGKKKHDTGNIAGGVYYHLGKVVLAPVGTHGGTLKVDVKRGAEEAATYYLALELKKSELKSTTVPLKDGKLYAWSVTEQAGNTVLEVKDGEESIRRLEAPSDSVTGFGFATTVRFAGRETDLSVIFD